MQIEIGVRINELIAHFKEYNAEFTEGNFEKGMQIIKNKLQKSIVIQQNLVLENEMNLREIEKEIKVNKNTILNYENGNLEYKEIVGNITNTQDYRKILNLLNILEISLNEQELGKKEYYENKKLNELNNQSQLIQLEKVKSKIDLENKDYYTSEKLLIKEKNENNNYKEFLLNYSAKYESFLDTKEIKGSILQDALEKNKLLVEEKQLLLNNLELLKGKVQYINEGMKASSKITERENVTKQLKKLIEIQSKLDGPLKHSQKLIIKKIEKAFNLEVINKIYSRIEPHPELKLMEIVPSFIGDKPSLEIYAPMNEDRKDNPVLFFSCSTRYTVS